MHNVPQQMQPGYNIPGYSTSLPTHGMIYGAYPPKGNGVTPYINTYASTNLAVHGPPTPCPPLPYGYQMSSAMPHTTGILKDDVGGETVFEVHDSQLKAPIAVKPSFVYPSLGSQRIFSTQQSASSGTRNAPRICEAFQEGKCVLADSCNDVHVFPEYLSSRRHSMVSWLQNKEQEFKKTLGQDPRSVFRVFCADLKEIVEVPISALRFTKGLYVDPNLRARRARGGHQNQFAIMASQVPTACGLFSVDPAQCKWGRWCNQVHIEQQWMLTKKNEFESWSNNLEEKFNSLPSNHQFNVHDPHLKTSLSLPKASIAGFSRGLFQGSAKKAPSVCMLFQKNRCTAYACCNQIHVIPSYLNLYRRLLNEGHRMSEEERTDLSEKMQSLLQTSTAQSQQTSESNSDAARLNPQAKPFFPTPPNHALDVNEDTEECEQQHCDSMDHPLRRDSKSVDSNESFSAARAKSSPLRHRQQSMKAVQLGLSPSPVKDNGNVSKNNRSLSSGFVIPLGELVSVVDGDEPSQSSLQASQSNVSHTGRSYIHTNNPYSLNGSTSCAATPSFGWVQPVRSAGNSLSTLPGTNCIGHGSGPIAGKNASLSHFDVRQAVLGIHGPDFDTGMTFTPSPLPPFNTSTSTAQGSKADALKVDFSTPDAGRSLVDGTVPVFTGGSGNDRTR